MHPSPVARGFSRAGQGTPDEARASRYILKDYVNAKLLYCHPPPDVNSDSFNEETRALSLERVAGKKRAPVTRVGKDSITFIPTDKPTSPNGTDAPVIQGTGRRSNALDKDFFENDTNLSARPFIQGGGQSGAVISRVLLYPHQHAVADDGTPLSRKAIMAGGPQGSGKKNHKKAKKVKQRSGAGYD
jgi:large subunit GTPase 1